MSIDIEKLRRQYQDWNPRLGGRGDCTLCGGNNQHHEDCWWHTVGELIKEVVQANELLEDRWNESVGRDMPLLREIEELKEKLEQTKEELHDANLGCAGSRKDLHVFLVEGNLCACHFARSGFALEKESMSIDLEAMNRQAKVPNAKT